jgi:hypothetical protein
MNANERRLTRALQDAIEMLRWQSRKPLGSAAWAEWIGEAVEAIDQTVKSTTDYNS